MPTEHNDDQMASAFRGTYQRVVDAVPSTDPGWPPVRTLRPASRRRPSRTWAVAGIALFGAGAFLVGWLAASGPGSGAADDVEQLPPTTAPAVLDPESASFSSPNEAVMAAAVEQNPDMVDPTTRQMIVIYADERIVDLRVKLQADGFCHWYGANGRVENDVLEWRAGPADACDPSD